MEGDARHDIFAVFALGVHEGDRIDDLHGVQIAEVSGHRSGPDIDGDAIGGFGFTRSHSNDLFPLPDAYGYLPVAISKRSRQLAEGKNINCEIFEAVLFVQFSADTLEISRRFLEARWLHFHIIDSYGGIMFYINISRSLTDDLLPCSRFLVHEDEQFSFDLRNTSQPVSG